MDSASSGSSPISAISRTSRISRPPIMTSTPQNSSRLLGTPKRRGRNDQTPRAKRPRRLSTSSIGAGSSTYSTADRSSITRIDSSEDDLEDELNYFATPQLKKIVAKGKGYTPFKPKSKGSLYAKIIQNSDIENTISTWINFYQQSSKDAMDYLMHLFIHVMGWQTVEMKYSHKMDYHALRMHLEQNLTKAHNKFVCIFRSKSSFGASFMQACHAFLQGLVHACNVSSILYERPFYKSLLSFIMEMCKSNNRIIILSTGSLALKICSSLMLVRKYKRAQFTDDGDDDVAVLATGHLHILNDAIEQLSDLLLKFSGLQDPKMYMLRSRIVDELQVWIKICPEHYINKQTFSILKRLILDENVHVRSAALKSCSGLIEKDRYRPYITNHLTSFTKLCEVVASRLKDVSASVEILAVKFFTTCTNMYCDLLSLEVQKQIVNRMYASNYMVARECGFFCLANLPTNPQERIKGILKLDQCPLFSDKTALLVQTLVACSQEFCDIKLMMNMIKSVDETYTEVDVIKLLEITCHMTVILSTGKINYSRSNFDIDCNDKVKDYVGGEILKNIQYLFEDFYEHDEALIWILKTLVAIDFSLSSMGRFKDIIIHMLKVLIEFLRTENNSETVLCLSSEIISKLCEENCPFSGKCKAIFQIFMESVVTRYDHSRHLMQRKTVTEQDYLKVKDDIYLLSIIMQHHSSVDFLRWDQIYSQWENRLFTNEMIIYQMKCCQLYFKWELKHLLQSTENDELQQVQIARSHRQRISSYLDSCLHVWSISNSYLVKVTAYESICDFFIDYIEIEGLIRENQQFQALQMQLRDNENLEQAVKLFVINYCFESTKDTPLTQRKFFIIKFVKLIFSGHISLVDLTVVLAFYHLFKEEYQSIYSRIFCTLKEISDATPSEAVLATLQYAVRVGKNVKLIKSLAMAFAETLPKSNHEEIIDMGIQYIIHQRDHIKFILFLKPFTEKLSRNERMKLMNNMKSVIPADYYSDEGFTKFVQALKSKQVRGKWVLQVPDTQDMFVQQEDTAMSVSESYEIEEIDDTLSKLSLL